MKKKDNFEDSDGQLLFFDKYDWLKPVKYSSLFDLKEGGSPHDDPFGHLPSDGEEPKGSA